MHRAIQKHGVKSFLWQEGPALAGAFLIADIFYKWGSFTLECLGFLSTWYVLSLISAWVSDLFKPAG